jgi:catechol 2,3-dioxygenase-like lactoylglutathione lyase family enzyme
MSIKFQSSVIFVKDIKASRHFYEELLGQEVLMDHGENVAFTGGFAIHLAEHAHQIIFGRALGKGSDLGHDNFELYFETDDLDAALGRLSDAGVEFVHTIREQPWGQRVFRVYDPDGHIVELGEPMPVVIRRFLGQGMSPEEVAKRTSMPLQIVEHIARVAGDLP